MIIFLFQDTTFTNGYDPKGRFLMEFGTVEVWAHSTSTQKQELLYKRVTMVSKLNVYHIWKCLNFDTF